MSLRLVILMALASTSMMSDQTTTLGVGAGGSPHVRSEWKVSGATIVVDYGRPWLRGRREQDMMPSGRPWRTGADAASVLRTDRQLQFGKAILQPGVYTLNTQPGKVWELIFGRVSAEGQWGTPYQPDLELYRVPMIGSTSKNSVEQLTISVDVTRTGGTLRIAWGTTLVGADFLVLPR